MADTGFKFPNVADGARDFSGVAWGDPNAIKTDDAIGSLVSFTDFQVSQGLAATDYSFSAEISGGSTIDGIEVLIGDYSDDDDIGEISWLTCRLILADNSDGSEDKKAELLAWTPLDRTDTAGGAFTLWTETINRADVVDVDWGFFIRVDETGGGSMQALIDYMQMKVFYTEHTNTGWKFPGTAVGNRAITGADTVWTDPDNIKADDASNTTITLTLGNDSFGLAASNFDFSVIPFASIIDGIEVRIGDYSTTSIPPQTSSLKLILADGSDGSVSKHDDLANWINVNNTDEVGGFNDLWGETITRDDVQDPDWGFFIGLIHISSGPVSIMDFMQMRVFYTNPTTAVTDWKLPGTVNEFGIAENWVNRDNVKVIDSNDASVVLATSLFSRRIIAQNFGFSIPAGATIVGLETRMGEYFLTGAGDIIWLNLTIRKSDDTNGPSHAEMFADITSSPQTSEAGGEFDLWGEAAPSITDVEDVDFGFTMIVKENGVDVATFFADSMQMRIHYVESAQGVNVTGTIVGATESQVQAGGRTIILDLTGVEWLAIGAPFDGSRQTIINGLGASQTETLGWNNEIRDNIGVDQVVRNSNTKVTITLLAAETADYKITADEVLTAIMLAPVHTGSTSLFDTDFATITAECDETLAPDSIVTQTNLSGSVTDIDESVDSPDSNWLLVA